jgi:hypothetical protein
MKRMDVICLRHQHTPTQSETPCKDTHTHTDGLEADRTAVLDITKRTVGS